MKQRLISAAVGLVILAAVLFLYDTPVLTIALAFLSGVAVYELLAATRYLPSRAGGLLCALFAGSSIFLLKYDGDSYFFFLTLFWTALVAYMLMAHRRFSFVQLSISAFTSMAVPLSFATVFALSDMEQEGPIYLLLVCVAAWVTDAAAFFVGKAVGKRKMAPHISPNKTIEGAIGGLAATAIIFPLVCYGYAHLALTNGSVSLLNALLIGLLCAFFGMMGDLFASAIKRETGIKDYGRIMPGHGGVMDRFDSFLFVAPSLFFLIHLFPIF